ncbi:hypothetical protein J437_LFUL001055 [Ladona fulva]|uniref:Uncharacterized protein n=1 Tax=Ladona fulva TaxID=123851 RepID=A0A8K0KB33_LADFU|nr:hypothetical protein J437_LFUL001055 [Ladona fulva]
MSLQAAKLSLDDLFSRGQVLGGGDGFTNLEDDAMATSSMDLGRGNGSEGVQSQRLSVGGGGGEGTGGSNRRKDDDDSGATTSDSSEGTYVETPVLAKVAGASDAAGEPTKVLRSCLSKAQNKNADDVDLHTSSEDGAGTSDLAVKQAQQKLSPVAVSEELKKQPESKLPSRPTKIRYTNDFLLKCALSPLSRIPPSNWENISSQYPSIVRKVLLPPPLTPFPLPRSVVNPPKYSYSWNPHMLMCPSQETFDPKKYLRWAQNVETQSFVLNAAESEPPTPE